MDIWIVTTELIFNFIQMNRFSNIVYHYFIFIYLFIQDIAPLK